MEVASPLLAIELAADLFFAGERFLLFFVTNAPQCLNVGLDWFFFGSG